MGGGPAARFGGLLIAADRRLQASSARDVFSMQISVKLAALFSSVGRESRALHWNGLFVDQYHLVLDL